ncbi:MAG: helix-turn-helix domain-containing protein [Plesiomonas shigelloides]
MYQKERAAPQANESATQNTGTRRDGSTATPPRVSGQLAEALNILRRGPTSTLAFIHHHQITRSSARVHELRLLGFNITTHTRRDLQFQGHQYHGIAIYVLQNPEWSHPSPPDHDTATS